MTKIYSVISNKGGVLKTSLCINIAGELSKSHRVLIIDTDGQSDVGTSFGVKRTDVTQTLYDCLTGSTDSKNSIINITENLDVITAGIGMNSYSKIKEYSIMDLKNLIKLIKNDYDFIFFDTAPTMNFATLQVIIASDEIIIPTQVEAYGITSISDTIKGIQEVKKSVKTDLKINNIIITKFDFRSKVHKKFLKDIQDVSSKLNIPLAKTRIPQTITGANSIIEEHKPPTLSKKWYRLQGIYSNLTREVIE